MATAQQLGDVESAEMDQQVSQLLDANERGADELTLLVLPVAEADSFIGVRLTNVAVAAPYLTGVLNESDIVLHPDGPLALTGDDVVALERLASFIGSIFEASAEGTIRWHVRSEDGAQRLVVFDQPERTSVTLDWQEILNVLNVNQDVAGRSTLKDQLRNLVEDNETSGE